MTSFKAVEIKFASDGKIPWWKIIWGMDIFIQGVPMLKSIVISNIIIWVILFWKYV